MQELSPAKWVIIIFLFAVVGFGLFVISYTWGVSGRFPLIWVLLGVGIGLVIFGGCFAIFEIPAAPPKSVVRSEDQAKALVDGLKETPSKGAKQRVRRVTRSDTPADTPNTPADTPSTQPQHASRSPDLSIEEKIFRAALSQGTMSVSVMWREFRDRDDVDITQKELKKILASLEGKKWKTPFGETYQVVSKPKHKGRRLVRA